MNTAKLPPINPSGGGKKSMFAKELENILTKELETRHQSSPGPPQLGPKPGTTQGQAGLITDVAGRPENKIPRPKRKGGVPSEMNSSLRQRAPAMFLRKLDQVC